MLTVFIMLAQRCLLVALFLPFSALDKLLNFSQAVGQASKSISFQPLARLAILAGFAIEVLMSAAILCAVMDRLAALVLAAYCILTALLWKQFWKGSDFRLQGQSASREVFWDFLKNLALAGGFCLLAFGSNAAGVQQFLAHPLQSSHPYAQARP